MYEIWNLELYNYLHNKYIWKGVVNQHKSTCECFYTSSSIFYFGELIHMISICITHFTLTVTVRTVKLGRFQNRVLNFYYENKQFVVFRMIFLRNRLLCQWNLWCVFKRPLNKVNLHFYSYFFVSCYFIQSIIDGSCGMNRRENCWQ